MCKASLDRNCISYIISHLLLRIFALILIGIPQMNHGLSSLETRNNNFEQQLHQSNELFMKSRISHTMDSQFHTTGDLNKDGNINSGSLGIGDSVPVHGITLNDNLLVNKDMAILKPRSDNFISNVENDQLLDEVYSKAPMFFGTENSTTVTTQIGATAHLPCVIHHIGDGVVSWIRRKDYHLLTVGLTPYSSDDRFSATHLKHSEDWTLQIKFVQLRDSGVYECQVSTHPPTSIFINLNVVEARAEIVGPQIRYLTPGSTLKFMCRIVQNTESSKFIFWYHDNRMINYDFDRGINVSTEADYHYSELTIQKATKEHSGNYTCVPSNVMPASVLVHVFKGDNTAAMYHDHRSTADKSYQSSNYLMVLMILILFSWNCDYHSLAVIQIKYYCR